MGIFKTFHPLMKVWVMGALFASIAGGCDGDMRFVKGDLQPQGSENGNAPLSDQTPNQTPQPSGTTSPSAGPSIRPDGSAMGAAGYEEHREAGREPPPASSTPSSEAPTPTTNLVLNPSPLRIRNGDPIPVVNVTSRFSEAVHLTFDFRSFGDDMDKIGVAVAISNIFRPNEPQPIHFYVRSGLRDGNYPVKITATTSDRRSYFVEFPVFILSDITADASAISTPIITGAYYLAPQNRSGYTVSIGGEGGAGFGPILCPEGQVVAAFKVCAGADINSIQIGCKDLNNLAATNINWIDPKAGGGGAPCPVSGVSYGDPELIFSNPGYAMIGWMANASTVLRYFWPAAVSLNQSGLGVRVYRTGSETFAEGILMIETAAGGGENIDMNPGFFWARSDEIRYPGNYSCPNNYVLTGIQGGAGSLVDQLIGICREVRVRRR